MPPRRAASFCAVVSVLASGIFGVSAAQADTRGSLQHQVQQSISSPSPVSVPQDAISVKSGPNPEQAKERAIHFYLSRNECEAGKVRYVRASGHGDVGCYPTDIPGQWALVSTPGYGGIGDYGSF